MVIAKLVYLAHGGGDVYGAVADCHCVKKCLVRAFEQNGFFVCSHHQYKNPSSQAYAHVFSANFAADCVKNPCRAKARLRIFAYSATKLCLKIRTHFL